MNTARNRSKVMAIALRAAMKCIRSAPSTQQEIVNAFASIDVVAEELEAIANTPDLGLDDLLEWVMENTDAGERVGERRTVHWIDPEGLYQEATASTYGEAIREAMRKNAEYEAADAAAPDPAEVHRG